MLQLLKTSDGSHTLKNVDLDETYHSIHGAIQESNHVFIKHGLHNLLEEGPQEIKILEVGFGTGLNALLTLLDRRTEGIATSYDSVEAFPLPKEIWGQLNYPDCLDNKGGKALFDKLHAVDWDKKVLLTPDFTICKMHADIQKTMLGKDYYDLVYYDAFAPAKQPELWSLALLESIVKSIKPGKAFVTYSARGQLKRDLAQLGMKVETLAGPPGKAEMVRAKKV